MRSFKRTFSSSVSTRLLINSSRISSNDAATPSVSCAFFSLFCRARSTRKATSDRSSGNGDSSFAASAESSSAPVANAVSESRVSVTSAMIVSNR